MALMSSILKLRLTGFEKKLKMKTSNLIRKILLFSKKREIMNTIFSWPPLS